MPYVYRPPVQPPLEPVSKHCIQGNKGESTTSKLVQTSSAKSSRTKSTKEEELLIDTDMSENNLQNATEISDTIVTEFQRLKQDLLRDHPEKHEHKHVVGAVDPFVHDVLSFEFRNFSIIENKFKNESVKGNCGNMNNVEAAAARGKNCDEKNVGTIFESSSSSGVSGSTDTKDKTSFSEELRHRASETMSQLNMILKHAEYKTHSKHQQAQDDSISSKVEKLLHFIEPGLIHNTESVADDEEYQKLIVSLNDPLIDEVSFEECNCQKL